MAEYIRKQDALGVFHDWSNKEGELVSAKETSEYKAIENIPAADVVDRRSCNTCKYYEGVHHVSGHAPCSFWNIGGVMWNDFCLRWKGEDNG